MKTSTACTVLLLWLLIGAAAPVAAQTYESDVVDASSVVLDEVMAMPGRGIPLSLLTNAQGVAIVPDLLKGGFIVGVRHGRGVLLVRDPTGTWQPPQFISINGGSVGWQIGLQATDLVLVFKTTNSIRGLLRGKLTLGADISAAAGPVGRDASASTDTTLRAEILSYSRSRDCLRAWPWTARWCRSIPCRTRPFSPRRRRPWPSRARRSPCPRRPCSSCGGSTAMPDLEVPPRRVLLAPRVLLPHRLFPPYRLLRWERRWRRPLPRRPVCRLWPVRPPWPRNRLPRRRTWRRCGVICGLRLPSCGRYWTISGASIWPCRSISSRPTASPATRSCLPCFGITTWRPSRPNTGA